jgi:hypothetical protein
MSDPLPRIDNPPGEGVVVRLRNALEEACDLAEADGRSAAGWRKVLALAPKEPGL